jgi:hypothetical protein
VLVAIACAMHFLPMCLVVAGASSRCVFNAAIVWSFTGPGAG